MGGAGYRTTSSFGRGSAAAAVGAFALCVATAAPAAAQKSDDERARIHFQAGESYFEQAEYDRAAEEFMSAYRLSQRPALLVNASLAYERALRFDEAIEALETYVEEFPDAPDRSAMSRRLEKLRELEARHAGGERDDDGTEASEGRADLTEPEEKRADDEPAAPSTTEEQASRSLGGLGKAGIGVGAFGVVAGVVALVAGVMAKNEHDDLESVCGPDATACPPGSSADVDRGETLAASSTAFTVLSLVGLAGGATLLVLDLRDGDDDSDATVAVEASPTRVGLRTTVRF
jgi:tetratricopeptide (TPR) repeat protein